jgi:hypothetical protein
MRMGEFTPFKNTSNETFYPTIRTPYYGIFYYLFRLLFPPRLTFELIAILQLLTEVLSILVFGKLVFNLTRSRAAYWISLLFLTLSSWITFYAPEIMTESFTCSFLLFGLYFYHRWTLQGKHAHLLLTGFFTSYAMLMKPFLLPWVLCFYISIFLLERKFTRFVKSSFLFSLPMLLLLSPWVIRNYYTTKEFILLTKPMYYPCKKMVHSCAEFLTAWGGDAIWWEGKCKTAGTYFFQTDVNANCEYRFPSYAFTSDYTLEDFRYLRDQIARFQKNVDNDSLDNAISMRFDEMRASFIRHKPFHYFVIAPLMRMKSAFIKSGSYYIAGSDLPHKALKLMQTALYWLPLFFGTAGLLVFGLSRLNDPFNLVLTGLPLSLVISLTVIFKLNEWRYFIHVFPLLIYFMILLLLAIKKRMSPAGN